MNILHYTIGLPPQRRGGSVQYAHDLMLEECRQGHKVMALICGDTLIRGYKTRIRRRGQLGDVEVYSLTNPLTPTLIYGTSEPDAQHRSVELDRKNLEKFVVDNSVEVMHIHTFMGLHKDVVALIKSLGVKIIYTTHDFHGICPHYNLINENGELCEASSGEACALCNQNEPSDLFLRLANSSLYQFLKSHGLMCNRHKTTIGRKRDENIATITLPSEEEVKSFQNLLDYYKDFFRLVDKFHFNSSQTREKYEQFLGPLEGDVIPVITKGIADRRKPLESHDKNILGFIGSLGDYKGFPMLKRVISELYYEGIRNITIKVYGSPNIGIDKDCPLIEYCGTYNYSDISNVLYHLDGILVPSKWYETFSLVTLESLAHGRPVIVSDHVGAKDIVATYNKELIFSTSAQLKSLIRKILNNKEFLEDENEKILTSPWNFSIENNAKEVISYYYE